MDDQPIICVISSWGISPNKQALTLGYQIDFLLERKHQELRDLWETFGTWSVLVRDENRLLVLSKGEG